MQNYKLHLAIRRTLQTAVITLFCLPALAQFTFPVQTLMDNGNRANRIRLAYMGDGYTSTQQQAFITNATTLNNALFAQAPFSNYRSFFNAYTIQVASQQAGARHPGNASDENTVIPAEPVANPNNFIGSTFDFSGIHRLLVPNSTTANSILAANVPDYRQGFVVVNSTFYGGSGGALATGSISALGSEVAIHEIGHSFAGLGDEYWNGFPGEYPNMSQTSNPATVRWNRWVGTNGIGVYAYGTTAPQNTWFRPHQNCKMQSLNSPFCAVCSEAIITRIHSSVNMIESTSPTSSTVAVTNSTNFVFFSVIHLNTTPATIKANWYLNGVLFKRNISSIGIPRNSFNFGSNTVRVDVVDTTPLSRSYRPAAGYIKSRSWTVTRTNTAKLTQQTAEPKTAPTPKLVVVPNPVDNISIVYYEVPKPQSMVSITVYNAAGAKVGVLRQEAKATAGQHTLRWNTDKLPPGQYLLEVIINGERQNKQVTKL
jgi:hypothetical protein